MNDKRKQYYYSAIGLDTIWLKVKLTETEKSRLLRRVYRTHKFNPQQNLHARHYKGMFLTIYGLTLYVKFSASTALLRHNVRPLPFDKINDVVDFLSTALAIDIHRSTLTRVDICVDLETDHLSSAYPQLLGSMQDYQRITYPDTGGNEFRNHAVRYNFYSKDEQVRSLRNRKKTDHNGTYSQREAAETAWQSINSPKILRVEISCKADMLRKLTEGESKNNFSHLLNPSFYLAILEKMSRDVGQMIPRNVTVSDVGKMLISGKKDRDELATKFLIETLGVAAYDLLLTRSYRVGPLSATNLKRLRAEKRELVASMKPVQHDLPSEISTKFFGTLGDAIESLRSMTEWGQVYGTTGITTGTHSAFQSLEEYERLMQEMEELGHDENEPDYIFESEYTEEEYAFHVHLNELEDRGHEDDQDYEEEPPNDIVGDEDDEPTTDVEEEDESNMISIHTIDKVTGELVQVLTF